MTRDEVRALAFVAFLVGLSALVRLRADPAEASLLAEDVSVEALAEESAVALEEAEARSRPLAEGETLDPNRVPVAQLDRLPGVGPATADRIAASRDSAPFATADDLLRVRGVGPATLEKIRPFLDLGPPPGRAARGTAGRAVPGSVPRSPDAGAGGGRAEELVDVNHAGAEALQALPGIGPALAARIIAHRDSAGPFGSADDLVAVRGIGPATLERFRHRLRWR